MKYIKHVFLIAIIVSTQLLLCMEPEPTENNIPVFPDEIIGEIIHRADLRTTNRLFTTCKTYNNLFNSDTEKQGPEHSFNQFLEKNPRYFKKLTCKQHPLAIGHYIKTNNMTLLELLINNETARNTLNRKNFIKFFNYDLINDNSTVKAYQGLPNGIKYTPICYLCKAAETNQCDVLKVLLTYSNIDINRTNKVRTALHFAVRNEHIEATKLLIKHKADVNSLDVYHETPLHIAAKNLSHDLIHLLLLNGANPKLQNRFGFTAQEIFDDYMLTNKQDMTQKQKNRCVIS